MRVSPVRRTVAVLLLVLFSLESSGCYSWHADTRPFPMLDHGNPADRYWVTLATGSVVQATNLHVQHDSMFGTADSFTVVRGSIGNTTVPMRVPVAGVTRIARRTFNVVGTVALVAAVAIVGFVALFAKDASATH